MITSRILVAALLSGIATALPHRVRDSSINEPAVSAIDGTPVTAGSQPAATGADNGSSGWSGSSMDSGSYSPPMADSASSSSMMMDSTSTMMDDSTSTMMDDSTSTMMMDSTSTMMMDSTSTSVAWNSYQTPTYGSGSSNWNQGSNYNDCVSQCMASYGSPPQPWTPPPTVTSSEDSGSSSGSGATHTIIVAPSQGVLRYLPFTVNASVGDTVRFMWGANNHTVTKSSELTPCNKTSDSPFTSGFQNKDFMFDQVVNDTNPTFFYCGVPTHCQKGMFGIINPPNAAGAGTSVSLQMSNWTSSNPDLSAYAAMVSNMTQSNLAVAQWGGNLDTKTFPDWAKPQIAENVLYTRSFLASNPQVMKPDGSIDLSSNGTPLMIPQDMAVALNNANSDAGANSSSTAASSPAAATSASPTGTAASSVSNGAATASPKFIVALAAAAASFFLL